MKFTSDRQRRAVFAELWRSHIGKTSPESAERFIRFGIPSPPPTPIDQQILDEILQVREKDPKAEHYDIYGRIERPHIKVYDLMERYGLLGKDERLDPKTRLIIADISEPDVKTLEEIPRSVLEWLSAGSAGEHIPPEVVTTGQELIKLGVSPLDARHYLQRKEFSFLGPLFGLGPLSSFKEFITLNGF
jgi:hypothetical protein